MSQYKDPATVPHLKCVGTLPLIVKCQCLKSNTW